MSEGVRVKRITTWETRDGRLHRDERSANVWADRLEAVDAGNAMLSEGATVADAVRRAGMRVERGSSLERITTDTQLIVSHYQCRREPGYRVVHIANDATLRVFGDAGSWSGPYGSYEPIASVERYAERTLRRQSENKR